MSKYIDLTGQVFGRLIAIRKVGRTKHKHTLWLCKCECGNETTVTTQNLRKGTTKSCGCLIKMVGRANRLTIEYVKNKAIELGKWKIMEDVYTSSQVRLKCICLKCGTESKKSWKAIRQGSGCRTCRDMKRRLDIHDIRISFEKEGYILLTTVYKNRHQRLDYICDKGHRHYTTWANWFSNKSRCPFCNKTYNYTLDDVKAIFESKNLTILDNVYINNMTPIRYRCSRGHEHQISLKHLLRGAGCFYCNLNRKLTTEIVREELAEEDYELLSDYVNNKTKFLYKCPNGHIHSMTYGSWYQGRRCPECILHGTSLFEQEVKDYVNDLNVPFISNDRTTILNELTNRYLELDIWFPNLNRAIECNGSYWHEYEDSACRDQIKIRECVRLDIQLLIVDYNEWNNNKSKCKDRVSKFLFTDVENRKERVRIIE